jgi:enoyl-[acyl-carrier protein] reductase/trans-2-enoyl-CoA reductase (NAD+)
MILKPMVRNNICLNSHPLGCAASVRRQIEYVKKELSACKGKDGTPSLALILGCSTGYGLASRIAATFGYGAATVGISLERSASGSKTGTPGFYNNLCFDKEAAKSGLVSITLNGDAYSGEMKSLAIKAVRSAASAKGIAPKIDLLIYSLASPVRLDPKTGIMHKSVIKPIGRSYSGKTVDMMTGNLFTASAEPASEDEIANTVKVMGGEDWELWIDALAGEDLFSPNARTLAYTYIGPELSWPIYKNGTIGRAKEDLERACREINKTYGPAGKNKISAAWISVNKALVTRASAVIPVIPFYVSCLFKVMKNKGIHEGCIEQITRLYKERLYSEKARNNPKDVPVDTENRIRIDDREMRDDVQKETLLLMGSLSGIQDISPEKILAETDVLGFKHDFLEAHGFDVPGIDYDADVNPLGGDI